MWKSANCENTGESYDKRVIDVLLIDFYYFFNFLKITLLKTFLFCYLLFLLLALKISFFYLSNQHTPYVQTKTSNVFISS